jgi:hypothetical protein
MNRVIQPKVKVTLVQGEIFNVTIGRAAWEACSASWNLCTNSAFALRPMKTTENFDRFGRSQDHPDANWLLANSPALNTKALILVIICAVFSFEVEEVEVKLRPTVSRSVRPGVRYPSGTRDQFFFPLVTYFRQLRVCYFVAPSLKRGRVCNLLLLLVLASAVPLRSESRGTQDHTLLSQFLRFHQPGRPGPRIYIPQEKSGPDIPRALGSLSVAYYDSQGYGGGILSQVQVQVILRPTVIRDPYDQICTSVGHLWALCWGAPSLTRGRVCNLLVQFAVTLRSKSRKTHDHILLSLLRPYLLSHTRHSKLGGQDSCICTNINSVAQL